MLEETIRDKFRQNHLRTTTQRGSFGDYRSLLDLAPGSIASYHHPIVEHATPPPVQRLSRAGQELATWATSLVPFPRPANLPIYARRAYTLEIASALALTFALATIEGGIIAVFVKQSFANSVPRGQLNVFVGVVGAMSELANILSFFWTQAAHARRKVPLIAAMQAAMILCVIAIAFLPTSGTPALLMMIALVLAARFFWSGYITLRPTLWRQNYPPEQRTRVVGAVSAVQVVVVACVGVFLGYVLDKDPNAYRVYLPIACAVGLAGVYFTTRMRIRREALMLAREREDDSPDVLQPWRGPLVVLDVLRKDPWYAQFMLWMFVLGFGNLTVMPTLVICLREEFGFGYLKSILVTNTIPYALTILTIPFWARALNRLHVVRFRAIHSWVFIAAGVFFTAGALTNLVWLYFLGAACMGVGFGGGSIAWNLGHVDFAAPAQTSRYMATHVTLNGIRGLMAPFAVTLTYEALLRRGYNAHLWVQVISLIISIIGAAGFVHLKWKMGKLAATHARGS